MNLQYNSLLDLLYSIVNNYQAVEITLRSERQLYFFLFFLLRFSPYSGHGLYFHEALKSHADMAYTVGHPQTSEQALRTLPENIQHSQRTDNHAVGGILSGFSQHTIFNGAT
jgi:hypothetical protein